MPIDQLQGAPLPASVIETGNIACSRSWISSERSGYIDWRRRSGLVRGRADWRSRWSHRTLPCGQDRMNCTHRRLLRSCRWIRPKIRWARQQQQILEFIEDAWSHVFWQRCTKRSAADFRARPSMRYGAWCGRGGSRMTPFMRCVPTWRGEPVRGALRGSMCSPIFARVAPWRRARKVDGRWWIAADVERDIADNSKSRGCVAVAEDVTAL